MKRIREKPLQIIKARYSDLIVDWHSNLGEDTIVVQKKGITNVCRCLKTDPDLMFDLLMDLTAVDYLETEKKRRFEVVYHLYSLKYNVRFRIKVPVSETNCSIDSVVSLWKGANWMEREVYDMYGITFNNHPDLRRILMYEGFIGHPLRKDYPIKRRQPLIGPRET